MPTNSPQSNKGTPELTQALASHRSYITDAEKIERTSINVGDVIKFMYNGEERTVFVLNPEYKMKLHGLSMKSIDRRTMMVEVFAKRDLYVSPTDFYARVVSQDAIKQTDSYRTYDLNKMGNIRRVKYQVDERGREEL
jgi:hypothetical protein